jgi:hypothetical protein
MCLEVEAGSLPSGRQPPFSDPWGVAAPKPPRLRMREHCPDGSVHSEESACHLLVEASAIVAAFIALCIVAMMKTATAIGAKYAPIFAQDDNQSLFEL